MNDQSKIAVVGLGYVGLPLAIHFGEKFATVGFDLFVSPYKSPWMASGYIQHALGYFLLSAVACHAFPKRRTWACLAGILCFGIVLELIQYTIPTRTFNL